MLFAHIILTMNTLINQIKKKVEMGIKTVRLSITIPEDLFRKLKVLAKLDNRSLSNFVSLQLKSLIAQDVKDQGKDTEYEPGDTITLELVYDKPETKTIVSATPPKYNRELGKYEQTLGFGPGTQPVTI